MLGFLFGVKADTTARAALAGPAGLPAEAGAAEAAAGATAAAFLPLPPAPEPLPAAPEPLPTAPEPLPTAPELEGARASFANCLASRALRRPALLRCRTPFEAARSNAWIASSAIANLSDSATGPPVSVRRAFVTLVFTSERTARFRAARRTPDRACFFADAVRLATRGFQEGQKKGQDHEVRIIEASGV